ncbi:hypothetical protein BJ684DRAFT_21231 [Piptocephalis cylindrospora]|uniref:Uncharacterized protein n=1 Tax=Piptocephalis cylindrospora TaxID=1907219 RepID=A0A4P9Y135_9FUNG|nr:hypothetical protein BJ684DRAFT_21231 [Piptocephalis cylindrospora]|eukprot:RKP12212.1 hypothetical protein BJ684DRAFT_21231 [Piptocephalis cylindrospora]
MTLSSSIPLSYLFLPIYLALAGTFAVCASLTTFFSLGLLSFRVYLVYASLIYGITMNVIQEAIVAFLAWASRACSSLAERWRPEGCGQPIQTLVAHNPLQPRSEVSHVRKVLLHPEGVTLLHDHSSPSDPHNPPIHFIIGSTPPSPQRPSRFHAP